MSNGNYSWGDVLLAVDVGQEAQKESREIEDKETAMQKEANAASAWSLGLSLLGVALGFGPIGYFAGKQIGKYAADWIGPGHDWEDMEVSEGKFNKEESRKYKRGNLFRKLFNINYLF